MIPVSRLSQFSSTSIQVTILVSDAGALCLSAFLSKITVSLSVITSRTISASVSKSELNEAKALIENVPNHQTKRTSALETRYAVASFGVLGLQYDLTKLPQTELEALKAYIACNLLDVIS